MQVLKNILSSEKTNLGKLELVDKLNQQILAYSIINNIERYARNIHILGLILDEIKTKPTWGKNQLKDLFLEKILNHLG